jgi:hypothetical protein
VTTISDDDLEDMEVDSPLADIQKEPTGETTRCENCGVDGRKDGSVFDPVGIVGTRRTSTQLANERSVLDSAACVLGSHKT